VAVHRAEPDLTPDRAILDERDALPRGGGVDREDPQETSLGSAAARNHGSLYFPTVAVKKVGREHFAEAEAFFG
jgi:hypothetical protein